MTHPMATTVAKATRAASRASAPARGLTRALALAVLMAVVPGSGATAAGRPAPAPTPAPAPASASAPAPAPASASASDLVPAPAQEELYIVATLPAYAVIAEAIVGDRGRVEAIASPRQDAHFVQARPSYSMMVSRADLLITTGLDLELWIPAVIDKSRNPDIREGEEGYVAVSAGVPMLQVPESPSRAGGDIHIFGNPHLHTDPLRAVIVADNIRVGLTNVDPDGATHYQQRLDAFRGRIHRRLFGDELVGLVGADKLAQLAMQGELRGFLEDNELGGEPLTTRLGGWLGRGSCFSGERIVAYHKNWIYFTDRFGVEIVEYVERRPGIPPSASHVARLVELMRREGIRVLWVANHFDRRIPELIAERTGARFLYVPLYPGGEGPQTYEELVDLWVETLRGGFPDCGGG